MKLLSIHLRHVFHFTDLKLILNPAEYPVAVIIGQQSSGKTAILKNIYQSLTWFSARFKDLRTAGVVMLDQEIMQNRVQAKIDLSITFPNELGTTTENSHVDTQAPSICSWQLYKTLNANGVGISRTEMSELEQLVGLYLKALQQDPLQGLPLIAYYPAERFINEINLLSKNNPAVMQSTAAYELTAIPFTTFARFFEWFREISDIENAQSAQLFQQILNEITSNEAIQDDRQSLHDALFQARSHLHTPSLQALKSSLKIVLPELDDIFIEYKPKLQLMVTYQNKTQCYQQLSNSIKNWIALVGDLVRRLCLLNPLSLYPCLEGDGILLIDHIDVDLDDAMAQCILARLHHAFPQIQIIVSSLHDSILESAHDFQCFELQQQKIQEIKLNEHQHDLDQLYERLQHVATELVLPEVINESSTAVEQFFAQFQKMSAQEQQQLRTLLHIDNDHSSQTFLS